MSGYVCVCVCVCVCVWWGARPQLGAVGPPHGATAGTVSMSGRRGDADRRCRLCLGPAHRGGYSGTRTCAYDQARQGAVLRRCRAMSSWPHVRRPMHAAICTERRRAWSLWLLRPLQYLHWRGGGRQIVNPPPPPQRVARTYAGVPAVQPSAVAEEHSQWCPATATPRPSGPDRPARLCTRVRLCSARARDREARHGAATVLLAVTRTRTMYYDLTVLPYLHGKGGKHRRSQLYVRRPLVHRSSIVAVLNIFTLAFFSTASARGQ
jgi:hypothetical protein